MIEQFALELGISYLFLIKGAVVVGLLFYLAFSFVVIKQTNLMIDTLEVGFEKAIKGIAILHFIAAFMTLFLAIFTL